MNLFKDEDTSIEIALPESDAVSMFLCVFLAKERLPKGQLDITTALVTKYAEYINNGVVEPYASTLLFSTETRKEMYEELKISAAQFNNAFKPLMLKGILAIEGDKYYLNPNILPSKKLIFNFKINAK
jgi:hypothetical protein